MIYRTAEVLSAGALMGMGSIFLSPIPTIGVTSIFRPMIENGWTVTTIGACLAASGSFWMLGIAINGLWYQSPTIRSIGALLGFSIWGAVTVLMVIAYRHNGFLSPLFAPAVAITIVDAFSLRKNTQMAVRENVAQYRRWRLAKIADRLARIANRVD